VGPESSTVTHPALPRIAAAAALSIALSPIVTAPLALRNENLPLVPQVQWVSFLGLGALFHLWLGRSAGPPAPRLRNIAAFACMIVLPLRGFWVNAMLPPASPPEYCVSTDAWPHEVVSRPLATPYVYLFAVVYLAATLAYFACRSARKRAWPDGASSLGAALVLLGFVEAALTTVQLQISEIFSVVAPISFGIAWCPVVSTLVLGRELVFAVRGAVARGRRAAFVRRTLFAALGVGAVCVAIPAVLTLAPAAAWRVFSRTSTWVFSTIPISYDCSDPAADRP
jgi:hypothetical protein